MDTALGREVITAIDTSVLLDVILDDPKYGAASLGALQKARALGGLIACPVVWAEVRAAFTKPAGIGDLFSKAGIAFDPFDQACADIAGDLWSAYRRHGGSRTHLIPDFLVGAHAKRRGGRLLARDRGFYRRYFSGLEVIEPA